MGTKRQGLGTDCQVRHPPRSSPAQGAAFRAKEESKEDILLHQPNCAHRLSRDTYSHETIQFLKESRGFLQRTMTSIISLPCLKPSSTFPAHSEESQSLQWLPRPWASLTPPPPSLYHPPLVLLTGPKYAWLCSLTMLFPWPGASRHHRQSPSRISTLLPVFLFDLLQCVYL